MFTVMYIRTWTAESSDSISLLSLRVLGFDSRFAVPYQKHYSRIEEDLGIIVKVRIRASNMAQS